MSSYKRRLYRQAVRDAAKIIRQQQKPKPKAAPPKLYRKFNISTKDGENKVVTSNKPMALEEAQYHFDALSISGNE